MNIDILRFVYPDGPRDAEALLLNSKGDIFIISKESNQAGVYRSLFPQSNSSLNTLEKMGTLNISSVTAGDASKGVLLKNYTQVFYWSGLNAQNEDWAKLLLEQEAQFLNYTLEPQGEAIAWQEDEGLFYTLSEEVSQEARLYLYRRQ